MSESRGWDELGFETAAVELLDGAFEGVEGGEKFVDSPSGISTREEVTGSEEGMESLIGSQFHPIGPGLGTGFPWFGVGLSDSPEVSSGVGRESCRPWEGGGQVREEDPFDGATFLAPEGGGGGGGAVPVGRHEFPPGGFEGWVEGQDGDVMVWKLEVVIELGDGPMGDRIDPILSDFARGMENEASHHHSRMGEFEMGCPVAVVIAEKQIEIDATGFPADFAKSSHLAFDLLEDLPGFESWMG